MLLVLATLALFVGSFALWVRRQLLDTDNWVTTSSQLISNQQIDKALSSFLVDQVITAPGVSDALGQIPGGDRVVAALRPVAANVVSRELQTEPGQRAWRTANRAAHRQLIDILNGGGKTVSTREGVVTLNLKPLVDDVARSLGDTPPFSLLPSGIREQLVAAIPDQSGQLVIVRSDQLRTAQNVVKGVRGLAVALPISAVVLYLLALLVATGWRRRVFRTIGWCLIVLRRAAAGGAAADRAPHRGRAGDRRLGAAGGQRGVADRDHVAAQCRLRRDRHRGDPGRRGVAGGADADRPVAAPSAAWGVRVVSQSSTVSFDQQLSARERSESWAWRFRLREAWAHSLVIVPCAYIVAAGVLGELVPRIEGSRDLLSLGLDADTARTILSSVASGMIAFTGLVVTIAVVVVQFAATQYTPRLVARFRGDPLVKHALGVFVAPTIYALVGIRNIGRYGATSVPSLTVVIGMALLIAALIVFFVLVGRLLDLMRPRRVVARVVERGGGAIREAYPFPVGAGPRSAPPAVTPVTATIRHSGRPRVLSALDRGRIVRIAGAADVIVEVALGIGATVPTNAPLFFVHGPADGVDAVELRRAALLAEERTIARIRRSRCARWSTSRSGRCRLRSTTRRPPCRCSTESRSC